MIMLSLCTSLTLSDRPQFMIFKLLLCMDLDLLYRSGFLFLCLVLKERIGDYGLRFHVELHSFVVHEVNDLY